MGRCMYVVVVAISTCCRDNTHPKTNNKKSGGEILRKDQDATLSTCEGMNQSDSATGMHDCVINNRGESSTSRPVKGNNKREKSDHVTRKTKPRAPHHEHNPLSPRNPYHESPTKGSNLESGEKMYGASCLRGENGRGVSRRFMIMRATSCGMLTMAVLPGLTLAPSVNV